MLKPISALTIAPARFPAGPPRTLSSLSPLFLALLALVLSLGAARALPGPAGGSLVLRGSEAGAAPLEAPLLATDIAVEVSGPTARATVTQAFRNTTDRWMEGTYLFPLPEEAAVDAMTLVVGGKVIVADIRERAAARRDYEAAKASGRSAALVEQQRPNVFTNAVANIAPGETVLVRIAYQQAVPSSAGTRMLRLPLVVAPRYHPAPPVLDLVSERSGETRRGGDPVPDRRRLAAPVLDPASAGPVNPVSLSVRLEAGFPVGALRSTTHAIHVEETGPQSRRVTLGEGVVPADRDFELTWAPAPAAAPSLGLFRETVAGSTYLLATIEPPAAEAKAGPRLPRDVTFVIDNSGSMSGASIRQAKAGLLAGLARLSPEDRFNVIRFDDTMDALFPEPMPADDAHLGRAEGFVRALEARGGTEMLAPLKAALVDPHPEERARLRQVVFLTDGAIGNEDQIFAAIHDGLGRSRLFMVGIGSAPNGHLMRHAAEIGRGSFTAIHTAEEVAERIGALFVKLESPVVTDLVARFSAGGGEITPDPLPDLYRGEPVVLAARLAHARGEGSLTVSGRIGGAPWSTSIPLDRAVEGKGVSKLWARARIGEAETARITGRLPPAEADAQILRLGLGHGLVTRLTSLVALDATPRRPAGTPLAERDLPLNLPAGWDFAKIFGEHPPAGARPPQQRRAELIPAAAEAGIGLPQTAETFQLRLLAGLGLALLGLVLGLVRSGRARLAR